MDDKNKPMPPRKPVSREGVVYTPSSAATGGDSNAGETRRVETVRAKPTAQPRRKPTTLAQPPRKKPSRKKASTGFAVFFIVTVILGVVVCIVAFAVAFKAMRESGGQAKPTASAQATATVKPGLPTEPPAPLVGEKGSTALGILLAVNTNDKSLSVYDATNNKQLSFTVDGTTSLKDKFGQNIVFAEFAAGDIVDLTVEDGTNKLLAMKTSAQAWLRAGATKVKADTVSQQITLGNETFTYNAHLVAQYKGSPFDIAELDPAHTVDMRGYQSQLLYIEVTRSFGHVSIARNKDILQGKVELGLDTYVLDDLKEPIKVSEGTHRVIVTGSNIDRYETEIEVKPGETVTVSLGDVTLKAGVVTVTVNETDAKVTVDGVTRSTTEPFVLDYGDHVLRVEKEGFEPYEESFAFNEASRSFSVTLERILKIKSFTVETYPHGADVYVDNAYIGISPVVVTAEHGQHTLTLRMTDYVEVSFSILVNDETAPQMYTLQPQAGVVMPETFE